MLTKVAIMLGSRSDLPQLESVIKHLQDEHSNIQIDKHILSCHRNVNDLNLFVFRDNCMGAEAIFYCGGKAFAAPGVLKANIDAANQDIPVFGIALGKEGSKSLQAAILSIEELPGTPVMLKEDGSAYVGANGLVEAFERAVIGNLPEAKKNSPKKAEFRITI